MSLKIMNKILALICFQLLLIGFVFSQEQLRDLEVNPNLVNSKTGQKAMRKSVNLNPELPFFDDFCQDESHPNMDLWIDRNVYINDHYAINPPSIGVATFDAVDEFGYIYNTIETATSPADKLTSRYIDMESADQGSTYLSFYYQPQGLGNNPEFNDSLVLNVISKDSVFRIWHANGTDYKSFVNDSLGIPQDSEDDYLAFKLVHLKLDNSYFFSNSFQIQFINYANIPSIASRPSDRTNKDHWHIDYVYLNDGRTAADTIFSDVAIYGRPSIYMRDYSSMPWNHYKAGIQKQATDVSFFVRNNDNTLRRITELLMYSRDLTQNKEEPYFYGLQEFDPFSDNLVTQTFGQNVYFDWYEADSAVFEIEGVLQNDKDEEDIFTNNDRVSRQIKFVDYYAYDDGSAEKTYGIDADRAKVAYRFFNYKADSLKAVQMYFVRNKEEYTGVQNFTFCVWDDASGEPGNLIYAETDVRPMITDHINEFVTLELDTALYLEKGKFYIGWKQNSDKLMNVGYDANAVMRSNIFYKVQANEESKWYASAYRGALMMRPVFGAREFEDTKKSADVTLEIMPNPSAGEIELNNFNEETYGVVHVFNLMGVKVYEQNATTSQTINLNHLNNGMYIVTFFPVNDRPRSTRLIISK